MTRQSKNSRKLAAAKVFSAARKAGRRTVAPKQTHGKDFTKRATYRLGADYLKRMEAFKKAEALPSARGTKAANRILKGAGSAAHARSA